MRWTRRQFLKTLSLAGAASLVGFGRDLAFAQSLCQTNRKTLVFVHLGGGAHSLSLMPPRQLQSYYDRHPSIGVINPLTLTSDIGLHPALQNIHRAFTGSFSNIGAILFNQVGFLNPDGSDVNSRSHAYATDQMAKAVTTPESGINSGWLARYAARHCYGQGSRHSLYNFQSANDLLYHSGIYPVTVGSLQSMNYADDTNNVGAIGGSTAKAANKFIRDSISELNIASGNYQHDHQELFGATQSNASEAIATINQVRAAYSPPPTGLYASGNPLNQKFMDTVALINSWNLSKVSVVSIAQHGYDTHADQGGSQLINGSYVGLSKLFFELDQVLGSFFQDLINRNLQHNVVVVLCSEFGRTFENGSKGTDHGTGGAAIVLGENVRRSIGYCNYTNSHFTNNGISWLPAELDLRNIYRRILEDHLGVDADPILPEPYVNSNIPIFT